MAGTDGTTHCLSVCLWTTCLCLLSSLYLLCCFWLCFLAVFNPPPPPRLQSCVTVFRAAIWKHISVRNKETIASRRLDPANGIIQIMTATNQCFGLIHIFFLHHPQSQRATKLQVTIATTHMLHITSCLQGAEDAELYSGRANTTACCKPVKWLFRSELVCETHLSVLAANKINIPLVMLNEALHMVSFTHRERNDLHVSNNMNRPQSNVSITISLRALVHSLVT